MTSASKFFSDGVYPAMTNSCRSLAEKWPRGLRVLTLLPVNVGQIVHGKQRAGML
jgi:hypothetical protein